MKNLEVFVILLIASLLQWGAKAQVYVIPDDAFLGSTLKSVAIPDTVTNLGEAAFAYCNRLTYVTIGNGVTRIAANDFEECTNLVSVVMGNAIRSIDGGAFLGCHSLTNAALPNTLTNIGGMAFQFCTSLTNVIIPSGVMSLGLQAFCCCFSLTNIALPDGLFSVGDFAFYGCTNLTSIMIPINVTNIGFGAFDGCVSLAGIGVDALNPAFSSVDGILFNKTQTELIRYPPAKAGKYWIPSGVTVGPVAFDSYHGWLAGVLNPSFTPNNGFGFTISWPTNAQVVIEATSNLIPPIVWTPISTNMVSPGSGYFTEPSGRNSRFYRIR